MSSNYIFLNRTISDCKPSFTINHLGIPVGTFLQCSRWLIYSIIKWHILFYSHNQGKAHKDQRKNVSKHMNNASRFNVILPHRYFKEMKCNRLCTVPPPLFSNFKHGLAPNCGSYELPQQDLVQTDRKWEPIQSLTHLFLYQQPTSVTHGCHWDWRARVTKKVKFSLV